MESIKRTAFIKFKTGSVISITEVKNIGVVHQDLIVCRPSGTYVFPIKDIMLYWIDITELHTFEENVAQA